VLISDIRGHSPRFVWRRDTRSERDHHPDRGPHHRLDRFRTEGNRHEREWLDARVADASAFDGVQTITGREAGETTVVVVSNGGFDTLPVVVYDAGRSASALSDPNRAPFESASAYQRVSSSKAMSCTTRGLSLFIRTYECRSPANS